MFWNESPVSTLCNALSESTITGTKSLGQFLWNLTSWILLPFVFWMIHSIKCANKLIKKYEHFQVETNYTSSLILQHSQSCLIPYISVLLHITGRLKDVWNDCSKEWFRFTCYSQGLVCFQSGLGNWWRWWRMHYHESDVLKDGKNRFLARKPTLMIGGHVLNQIFALAEWRLCRIEVTGGADTGSSVQTSG